LLIGQGRDVRNVDLGIWFAGQAAEPLALLGAERLIQNKLGFHALELSLRR
jgi:hypothetical protein